MRFSLVIPVAPERDAKILDSIKEIDYPKKDFEIIVKNGKNPSENRNKGIEKAKGEFVVFLDDDASVKKDYLKKIKNFFDRYPVIDIVGGPQLTSKDENFFAKMSGIVLTSNFGVYKIRKRYVSEKINCDADETFLTSANLCARKNVFKKIGGFNTNLFPGEDPEFIFRAKKAGLKIACNPEMIIYHKRRGDFSSYCKQIFSYGFTRPKKDKISGKTNLLFLIPLIFSVYFLLLPTLFLLNYFLLIPLIMHAFLSIIFSVCNSLRNKSFLGIFMLPFLYLFTHLAYGLGMLAGYFNTERIVK